MVKNFKAKGSIQKKNWEYIGILPILGGGGGTPDQYISVFPCDKNI